VERESIIIPFDIYAYIKATQVDRQQLGYIAKHAKELKKIMSSKYGRIS